MGLRPAYIDHDHMYAVAAHGVGTRIELVASNAAGHFPLGLKGFHRDARGRHCQAALSAPTAAEGQFELSLRRSP